MVLNFFKVYLQQSSQYINSSLTNWIKLTYCLSISNKNKTFAWDVAGEQIFNNVVKNNNYIITYPVKDKNGDIEFCGNKFSLHTQQIGGDLDVNLE